jgi:hypothetical protein
MSLAKRSREDRPGISEIAGTVLLTILEAFLAFILSVVIFFLSIRVAGCAGSCNLAVGQASIFVTPGVGVGAVVLTVIWAVRRGMQGSFLWLAPVAGMVLVVIGFVIALIMNNTALTPGG